MTAPPPRRMRDLKPIRSKSLVDEIVDAIVEATATGVFLPGDRIVEAEVARQMNVSRIPVREALRLLESQGVVVSERYRGMRLMSVNIEQLEKTLKVRLALERLAGASVLERLAAEPDLLLPLEEIVTQMRAAAARGDSFEVASLDTGFHRKLCELSGNEVLLRTWEPLSRQLTIIFGLSTRRKDIIGIVEEHDDVLETLKARDIDAFDRVMVRHILEYSRNIDYEELVSQMRQIEGRQRS